MAIRTVSEGHKKVATPTGFEPVRAEPTHLAGERLNHSAKASLFMLDWHRGCIQNVVNEERFELSPPKRPVP